jgi:hypothetical protein
MGKTQVIDSTNEIMLDDKTVGLLNSINIESAQAIDAAIKRAAEPYQQQINGVARLLATDKGLQGNWRLVHVPGPKGESDIAAFKWKLVCVDAPAPAEQPNITQRNPRRK